MNASVATELNYIWKIKKVGQAYMSTDTGQLKNGSPTGNVLYFSIYTADRKLTEMWSDGQLSL